MSGLEALRGGGKVALARALARIESRPSDPETVALLDEAWARPAGHAIGLTGPPGVGKSTLTDALIRGWRARGRSVAVIAVDPSSRRSRGALLGDRTRLTTDPGDEGVFVRSMAARDRLGGLAATAWPSLVLMRALFDIVILETVGVGQSETEIEDVADTVVFCAQPGAGDALQFMKAGVVEIPHLVVVTKADMGAIAHRAVADLKVALSLAAGDEPPAVVGCSAATGEGVESLIESLDSRAADMTIDHAMQHRREAQVIAWLKRSLSDEFGTAGFSLLQRDIDPADVRKAPFKVAETLRTRGKMALLVGFQPQ
ncbi:MAG: ArgK/MeaB family GTPase [Rubrimonas sp.]